MATNPNVPQGVLNRLVASISFVNNPALNITSPYLGREAIRLRLEGEATGRLPTLTGIVTSPQPFLIATVTAHLVKSQPLSEAWKAQAELSTLVGPFTVRPDIDAAQNGISAYPIENGMIMAPGGDLAFSGATEDWMLTLSGYYIINNLLWQAA